MTCVVDTCLVCSSDRSVVNRDGPPDLRCSIPIAKNYRADSQAREQIF